MDHCEENFISKSQQGNEMVLGIIDSLSSALVYPDQGNFVTNKKLWNTYAKEWDTESEWVQDIAKGTHTLTSTEMLEEEKIENKEEVARSIPLCCLGEEWSKNEDLQEVIEEYIIPYLTSASGAENGEVKAGEVGCGGGRLAARVASLVSSLDCYDISSEMLQRAERFTEQHNNIQFYLLETPEFPTNNHAKYDFLYCFDVMVHMDLHLIYRYMCEFYKLLKPGAKAFISTANLISPAGWNRFSKQAKYTVGGFYFLCPEMVKNLLEKAGFEILKESSPTQRNVYYDRDFLVVIQKPSTLGGESLESAYISS